MKISYKYNIRQRRDGMYYNIEIDFEMIKLNFINY